MVDGQLSTLTYVIYFDSSVCLSLSIPFSLSLYIHLSACLSICLCVPFSLSLSIYLSVCPTLSLSLSLSLTFSVNPSVCLSICPILSLCPSICLPVCLSLFLCLSVYLMAFTERNFASIIKGVEMMSVQIKTVFQSGMLQLMEYDCRSVQKKYFVFSGK